MWNDARTINLIANTLAVLAVAAMLLAGVAWVAQRPYFTLAAIEIESMPETEMHYVSTGAVRAAIAGRFGAISLPSTWTKPARRSSRCPGCAMPRCGASG